MASYDVVDLGKSVNAPYTRASFWQIHGVCECTLRTGTRSINPWICVAVIQSKLGTMDRLC